MRLFQLAAALDIDVLGAVDQDIADRRVLQQQLERSEAEGFVEHFFDQPLALLAVEQRVFGIAEVLDDEPNFAREHVAFQLADAGQVELVDELAVDAAFEFFKLGIGRFFVRASGKIDCLGHGVRSRVEDSAAGSERFRFLIPA